MRPDEKALLAMVYYGEDPRPAGRYLCIHPKRVLRLCEKWKRCGWFDETAAGGGLTTDGRLYFRLLHAAAQPPSATPPQ